MRRADVKYNDDVDEVVDERLKNIDPNMVKLITNEVMYFARYTEVHMSAGIPKSLDVYNTSNEYAYNIFADIFMIGCTITSFYIARSRITNLQHCYYCIAIFYN